MIEITNLLLGDIHLNFDLNLSMDLSTELQFP